jgi:protoheme IX farnesyltransferase
MLCFLLKNFKINFLHYFELIKPRIIIANLFSAIAGFFFSLQNKSFNLLEFVFMIVGLFCIISCGCVLNNIYDRKNDRKMLRTQNRVLARKKISIKNAFIYSFFLFFLGSYFLLYFCNKFVYLISFLALLCYVFLYTVILKNKSKYSTFFGSFSGSCPILIGYFLNIHFFDLKSFFLFFIFFFWQIPHSYSIYLLYLNDYCSAKIPVFPVLNRIDRTIDNMYFYTNLLILFNFLLGFFSDFNFIYFLIFTLLGIFWLFCITSGYNKFLRKSEWSLELFKISIFYIFFFNFSVFLNYFIF